MTKHDDTEHGAPAGVRSLDMAALKALAHPLRAQILSQLSTFGPATASGLGESLGESSGATSYHLRQLAKHGLVREVAGRGTARERWWERPPGSVTIGDPETEKTEAGRAATRLITRELNRGREQLFADYLDRGSDLVPEEWRDVSTISTSNLTVTLDQFRNLVTRFEGMLREAADAYRDQDDADARAVQIQVNAFPVIAPARVVEEAAR